jgi:putative RecB family exonuclease
MARASTFSHSRLSAYETCPRKYRFRYVDGIDLGGEGIEAFTGTLVHDALEWLHTEVAAGRVPDLAALTARFREQWQARWHAGVVIVRESDTPEGYQQMGARCLAAYHRRYHPFDRGEVVGLELQLQVPLDALQQHWILGYADRVTRLGPGRYEIRDYKTGRWVPPQEELDRDRQLALYQLALPRLFPDVHEVVLVWNYLQKDVECSSRRTPAQLESLRQATLALVLEIVDRAARAGDDPVQADVLFPTRESRLCDWCDYRTICPALGARPDAWRDAQRAAREQKTGQLELF